MRASYVADSGYDGPLVTAFAFGGSAELAGELGLVVHDPRRATAELVQALVAQGESLPRVGGRCLVPGGDGLDVLRRYLRGFRAIRVGLASHQDLNWGCPRS